jgi:hypothetical protein
MEIFAVAFVYAGAAAVLLGLLAMLRRAGARRRVWLWVGAGVVFQAVGLLLPSREMRIAAAAGLHDRFAPVFQFHEVHETGVRAPRGRVWKAVRETAAREIPFFRELIWLRRVGRAGPERALAGAEHQPLLDVAVKTSFLLLAEEPGREIVIGTLVLAPREGGLARPATPAEYGALALPGYAKATMNFVVDEPAPGLCRVRTETRVFAADAGARRRFAAYWRIICPGSALIRRMWLRAIRLRAERE